MRPLAVLILILGAGAALLFAVLAMTGGETRSAETIGPVVKPVNAADAPPPADIDAVRAPAAVPLEEDTVRRTTALAGEEVAGAFPNAVEGVVFTPDKRPLAGAQVSLVRRESASQFAAAVRLISNLEEPKVARRSRTDEGGRYRFDGITPGSDWNVFVNHELYAHKEQGPFVVPESGTLREDVVLERGFALHGFVTEAASGRPIAGAEVLVEDPTFAYLGTGGTSPDAKSTVADDKGYYSFPNIGNGQKMLTVRARRYATAIYNVIQFMGTDQASDDIEKNVALEYGKTIAGRVLSPERRGVGGVVLDAIGNMYDPGSRGLATSSADGEFLIEGLAPGAYTLRPEAEGWDVEPILRVQAGDTNVEILLFEQGTVMGKVVDGQSGRPIQDFRCTVRSTQSAVDRAWGSIVAEKNFRNRQDGSFKIEGVSQATYVIQADSKGYATSFSDPFTVTQGMSTADIVVKMSKGGTLRGRVVDGYSGQPIAQARVSTNDNNWIDAELMKLFGQMEPNALTKTSALTDDRGEFEIALILPESYQIRVDKSGYTPYVENDVTMGDGLTTDIGGVTLFRGARVMGKVYLSDGSVAAGVNVTMTPADGSSAQGLRARSNGDGDFLFDNAAPGSYKLAASRVPTGRGSPFDTIIDIKNSEIDITLADGQQLVQDLRLKTSRPAPINTPGGGIFRQNDDGGR